jgi:uncharacterized membrane protein
MTLSGVLFIVLVLYGVVLMWPLKRKIMKKHGRFLSNLEMQELAASGDVDAQKLKKMTRIFLALGVVFALLFVLEKYRFINF